MRLFKKNTKKNDCCNIKIEEEEEVKETKKDECCCDIKIEETEKNESSKEANKKNCCN
ncbi:MAG: hypothetical protein N4A49_10580 [Marinifilaceae bacterium]|jgi:hypothetical protein|nr:hypothetical protein [Marinifilaceae bacterium]